MKEKLSFFERLTGNYRDIDEGILNTAGKNSGFMEEVEEANEEGQLTVDAYQTANEIIIQSFVAGVKIEDLDVSITQDMVTIKGRRMDTRRVEEDDFFSHELYWGSFGRTILLPQEVDPDEAEATMKNGLLTIRLQKLDKERVQKLKIKNE